MTRIVFLDYDGVVACTDEAISVGREFGPTAAANVTDLCRRWNARLVITSSWRWASRLKDDEDVSALAAARRFLVANGIHAPLFDDERGWAVPELWAAKQEGLEIAEACRARHGVVLEPRAYGNEHARRGDEVQVWLDHFLPNARPEDWILLDDEDDYWPGQMSRLVKCLDVKGYDAEAHHRALKLAGLATAPIPAT